MFSAHCYSSEKVCKLYDQSIIKGESNDNGQGDFFTVELPFVIALTEYGRNDHLPTTSSDVFAHATHLHVLGMQPHLYGTS